MTDPNLPVPYDEGVEPPPIVAVSERSRTVALVLGVVGGWAGMHRFYVGKTGTGVCQLLTLGGIGLWWLYDMVLIVAGEFRDEDDLRLLRWSADDPIGSGGYVGREIRALRDDMDELRSQVTEVAERMDFAERLLAQQKERPRLPRGEEGRER